jgi:hypothetical protein
MSVLVFLSKILVLFALLNHSCLQYQIVLVMKSNVALVRDIKSLLSSTSKVALVFNIKSLSSAISNHSCPRLKMLLLSAKIKHRSCPQHQIILVRDIKRRSCRRHLSEICEHLRILFLDHNRYKSHKKLEIIDFISYNSFLEHIFPSLQGFELACFNIIVI